jgi:PleD family two-component response regulator
MLAAELAAAMYALVCKNDVIETRYCHCDDIDSPVQEELPAPTMWKGDTVFGYEKHVLVVNDDQSAGQETTLLLERVGFIVVQASDGLDALNDLQQQHFDAVVTDSHTSNLNGFELLAQSRVIRSDTPVIIVSKAQ